MTWKAFGVSRSFWDPILAAFSLKCRKSVRKATHPRLGTVWPLVGFSLYRCPLVQRGARPGDSLTASVWGGGIH